MVCMIRVDNTRRNMSSWNVFLFIFFVVSYNQNDLFYCHGLSVTAATQNTFPQNNPQSSYYSPSSPPEPIIPITVISGFLGAGKTSLLKHLLENKQGLRIGVIVNDLASVNIDSKLLAATSSSSSALFGGNIKNINDKNDGIMMLELQNGCACCSRSEELLASVAELVTLSDMRSAGSGEEQDHAAAFQHIVIEMSGVADPKGIRAKFQEAQLYDMPLMERVRLDTMVTLIDCTTFLQHLTSAQIATPNDAPELYYSKNNNNNNDEQQQNVGYTNDDDDLAFAIVESMNNANSRAYGESVASLLVSQTETADVILLNKIDLLKSNKNNNNDDDKNDDDDDNDVLSKTRDIVAALNPRAHIFATRFGQLPGENTNQKIVDNVLAVARGQGVVMAGVVDDHRDAVQAVVDKMMMSASSSSSTLSTTATTPSHSHSHEHATAAAADASSSCNDPDYTDTTTTTSSHSHRHDHHQQKNTPAVVCTSPDCTDTSHSHSHDHQHSKQQQDDDTSAALHAGIGSFVYRARRPFHPHRLYQFLQNLPVTRGLETTYWNENDNNIDNVKDKNNDLKLSVETAKTMQNVIRSKGFCWLADSNRIASFWSQAGTSFELQQLGSWWATLPRNQWPPESIPTILVDFDDVNHHDDDDSKDDEHNFTDGSSSSRTSVGDRRQEVVLIGPSLADPVKQQLIHHALEQCLLTDTEWNLFNKIKFNEQELAKAFPNPIAASVLSY